MNWQERYEELTGQQPFYDNGHWKDGYVLWLEEILDTQRGLLEQAAAHRSKTIVNTSNDPHPAG